MTELAIPTPGTAPDAGAADAEAGLTVASISPRRQAYLRFREHKAAVASCFVLAVLVAFVVLSPITARYAVNEAIFKAEAGHPNSFLAPRSQAWFGTDSIGRDLYSRLIYGVRVSLVIGLASAIISILIGVVVGAVAGLRGGLFDDIMMRITDVFLAFPVLVSLLITRQFLGSVKAVTNVIGEPKSIRFLIFLFAIFGWMSVARLVRSQVLALKEREFIEASRALGGKNWRLIRHHMLPNSIGPLLVSLSLGVVGAIISEATLALFGYGPDPGAGSTSLGVLVAESKTAVQSGYWWLAIFPFIFLLLITLSVSFIGDGLRDATDPKSTGGPG